MSETDRKRQGKSDSGKLSFEFTFPLDVREQLHICDTIKKTLSYKKIEGNEKTMAEIQYGDCWDFIKKYIIIKKIDGKDENVIFDRNKVIDKDNKPLTIGHIYNACRFFIGEVENFMIEQGV